MRRILATVLVAVLVLMPSVSARQSFVEAFNFRENSAYVTDGANQTYVLPGDTYPVTRAGVTFGWTVSPAGCRDRSTSLDVRLAGICFGDNVGTFRVDLPGAGTYNIGLSMGDAATGQTQTSLSIHDNATLKFTIGPHDVVATTQYYDASNVSRTDVTWPTNQTPVSTVFASSILLLKLGDATSNSVVTHLSISGSPSGGGGGSTRKRKLFFGIGDD